MDEKELKELKQKAETRGFVKGMLLALFLFLSNLLIRFIFEFWGK